MKKIIVVSYDLNPYWGSEATHCHNWLLAIAGLLDIEAVVHIKNRPNIERFSYPDNIHFRFIDTDTKLSRFGSRAGIYNLPYSAFERQLKRDIIPLIKTGSYEFIHLLSPAGIHYNTDLYRSINLPYVLGPIEGGLRLPDGFEKIFDTKGKIKNRIRTAFYNRMKRNSGFAEYVRHASRVIINTDNVREYLPEDLSTGVYTIFDSVVHLEDIPDMDLKPERNRIIVTFSGSIRRIKGIELLVDSAELLRKLDKNLFNRLLFRIIGDGPLLDSIKQRLNRNGLSKNFEIIGKIPRKKALDLVADSDIFCLPSLRENGGMAIIEAMAIGLPIITSDHGGPAFSVCDDCGIKIKPTSMEQYIRELAEAIARLANDRSLRLSMGKTAREHASKEFTVHAVRDKLRDIYEGLY